MRKQCEHASVQESVGCRSCNPRQLTQKQYTDCIENGFDPKLTVQEYRDCVANGIDPRKEKK
jgi:hypothetical protein